MLAAIKSGVDGAKVNGLQPEMVLAYVIACFVYAEYDADCTLTEGTGGKHGIGSLHYVGLAIDLRIWSFTSQEMLDEVVDKLKERLGDQYDVVLEGNHIHIEFQPR